MRNQETTSAFTNMIPNIIPKYLLKRTNITYEEVNPGAFGQINLQTEILEETVEYQVILTHLWP